MTPADSPAGLIDDRLAHVRPTRRRQLRNAVAAEWVKARSVPSTWTALGTFTVIMLALSLVIPLTREVGDAAAAAQAGAQPVALALSGVFMGQVALALWGALLVTGEFSSRSITTSTLAVPQRQVLLGAKAVLLVVMTAPLALLITAAATALGLAALDSRNVPVDAGDPAVVRAVCGGAVYLTLVAVLGLAAGAVLRSTAAAVVCLTGVLFLLPVLIGLLPASIADTVSPWLPSQAGQAAIQLATPAGYLEPLSGVLVLFAYTLAALATGMYRVVKRDV
ncbi:hypothetical protein [Catenuloplanes indicus]|uniref:ABC transporter permease n=1 Tax=Catenuloplanes indicus TaxID=137267 RepID=A0AAE4AV63_9ACTN|nr:hypothetical protein [Catenuloplanes indicus]MDQ0363619.1 hypothetical protein [Catenuloplanes indicus]